MHNLNVKRIKLKFDPEKGYSLSRCTTAIKLVGKAILVKRNCFNVQGLCLIEIRSTESGKKMVSI